MPIRYEIDKDEGLVRITIEGTTVDKDWTDALADMAKDSDFTPARLLIDARRHESVASSETMWKIGEMAGPQDKNARWALLVARPVSEGIAVMLSTLVDRAGVKVRSFRELDEAAAWLKSSD